jgi:hypothetical protein
MGMHLTPHASASEARLNEAGALSHMHGSIGFSKNRFRLAMTKSSAPFCNQSRQRRRELCRGEQQQRTELLDSRGHSSLMSYAKIECIPYTCTIIGSFLENGSNGSWLIFSILL